MKKLTLIPAALLFIVLFAAGCNNDTTTNNDTKKDTVAKDTIKSNPSEFSDPH